MAKKKLSRDQKRKQKLQKRPHASSSAVRQSASEKLVDDTERIIYETFMSYGRAMRDADVLEAVNQLVVDIQQGDVSKQDASLESPNAKGALVWNIKQRWTETHALETMPHLVAAQSLQALAQRVDGIMAPGESHSFLRFLQGSKQTAVLAALGPAAQPAGGETGEAAASAESAALVPHIPAPHVPDGDWSDDEAPLLASGLAWLRGSSEASWEPFRAEAARLTENGLAQEVANVSQYLYGLVRADAVEAALRPVLNVAHAKLGAVAAAEPEPEPTSSPSS
jgi:hypothetical protein